MAAAACFNDDAPRFLMHKHLGTRVTTAQQHDLAHLLHCELVCHETTLPRLGKSGYTDS